jgi:hypothetical protein
MTRGNFTFAAIALAVTVLVTILLSGPWSPSSLPKKEIIPESVQKICENFGGVKRYEPPQWVVKCKDNAFFGEDVPERCTPHGGLESRTNLNGFIGNEVFCEDGSLMHIP